MASCSGLLDVSSKKAVPLQGITVDVQVKGFVADVSATLKYKNVEEQAVEAVFVFLMDEDSAVYSFEAAMEGEQITAVLLEKEQAQKANEAISLGRVPFILEEDTESSDIFTCMVGTLLPGKEVEIMLSFVQELPLDKDGAVRFVLPAGLTPRCTEKEQEQSASATHPPVSVGEISYTRSLSAHVQSAYRISKVMSNCDITPIEYMNEDETEAKVSLTDANQPELERELLVYYENVHKAFVMVEAGTPDAKDSLMAQPVIALNFYPSFPEVPEQFNYGEFIFLVDRSGSMECSMANDGPSHIQCAKETLVLILKSLPLGCYFNVFGFGSNFESFFPESVEYTQQSMEEAVKKVDTMDCNFGGTEILDLLKHIYSTAVRSEHPRQLFLFTDGGVQNTQDVIAEVRKNSTNHRCFAFGIGDGASTALIKGISKATGGTYELITGKERMQSKVLKSLKCSLQHPVKDVSVHWVLPSGLEDVAMSRAPSAIFKGQRTILYTQVKGKIYNTMGQGNLHYNFKDDVIKKVLQFPLKSENVMRPTIHRLAAKALISKLEAEADSNSEEVRRRILETSIHSGVVSSLTAYVAVKKDSQLPLVCHPVQSGLSSQAERPTLHRREALSNLVASITLQSDTSVNTSSVALSETAELEASIPYPQKTGDLTLFRIIYLQNADGSWNLSPELASILGISEEEIEAKNPEMDFDASVWATLLAVIWLHTSFPVRKDEWELLEGKAVSWVKATAGDLLSECVQAGNELLKQSFRL